MMREDTQIHNFSRLKAEYEQFDEIGGLNHFDAEMFSVGVQLNFLSKLTRVIYFVKPCIKSTGYKK